MVFNQSVRLPGPYCTSPVTDAVSQPGPRLAAWAHGTCRISSDPYVATWRRYNLVILGGPCMGGNYFQLKLKSGKLSSLSYAFVAYLSR